MKPEPESEEAPLISRDDEGAPKVPFRSGTTAKGGAKRPDGTAEIESYFRQRGQHRIGALLLRGAVAIATGVVATTVIGCATMANLITVGAMPISVYFMLVWTAHTIAALFHKLLTTEFKDRFRVVLFAIIKSDKSLAAFSKLFPMFSRDDEILITQESVGWHGDPNAFDRHYGQRWYEQASGYGRQARG